MAPKEFTVKTEEDAYNLSASARLIGDDVLVAIWGGEKPHIGAVAVAQPRPSLRDPEVTSSSASVICRVGHKEDDLVKAAAEILAAALDTYVVVTGGIHWDDLAPEAIQQVVRNSEILVDMILQRCVAEFPLLKK
jgi:gallate decarboxylase subunit D